MSADIFLIFASDPLWTKGICLRLSDVPKNLYDTPTVIVKDSVEISSSNFGRGIFGLKPANTRCAKLIVFTEVGPDWLWLTTLALLYVAMIDCMNLRGHDWGLNCTWPRLTELTVRGHSIACMWPWLAAYMLLCVAMIDCINYTWTQHWLYVAMIESLTICGHDWGINYMWQSLTSLIIRGHGWLH